MVADADIAEHAGGQSAREYDGKLSMIHRALISGENGNHVASIAIEGAEEKVLGLWISDDSGFRTLGHVDISQNGVERRVFGS